MSMNTKAAAIDFGTSKIVVLLAESGGFNRCDIIGSGTVPYNGFLNGEWNDEPDVLRLAIRNAINAAEIEAKSHIKEIYVGIPSEYVNVMHAEVSIEIRSDDGRIRDREIDYIQDVAADKLNLQDQEGLIIHRSPAWFKVDDGKKIMSPGGMRGDKLTGMISFILADPVFVENVNDHLARIGITVMGYLSPSLGEALLLVPLDDRDRAAMLIDMGYLSTEVSVVEGDAIIYHAVLPMGGGHVAAELAQELDIALRYAERVKRDYVFSPDEFDAAGDSEIVDDMGNRTVIPRAKVSEIIDKSFGELMEMIHQTIAEAQPLLSPRSQVFLTGGALAMMRGGRETLAKRLGKPVRGPMAKAAKHTSPIYASALGLMDLVFDSIEQRSGDDDSITDRLKDGFRTIFKK